jgi:hypothetical protein
MGATQVTLMDDPLELSFQRWVRENGHVVDHLRRLAVEWHEAGHGRCAIAMLVEVARWQHGIRATGEPYAINNSYRSRVARLILATTPGLPHDFFSTRALRTEPADFFWTHERGRAA